jgi:hypothetical protein
VAATTDVIWRTNRDLVHWLGVITALASMLPILVMETSRWWAF